jgi:hypothetical protein
METQMSAVTFVRADEQMESANPGPLDIDPSPLLGRWINTNAVTAGIREVIVSVRGRGVSIEVLAGDGPTPRAWGDVGVDALYSAGVHASAATAFTARYELGVMETRLEANLSLGLLVIAALNTFKDGSGRSNYFAREFFYRWQEASHN